MDEQTSRSKRRFKRERLSLRRGGLRFMLSVSFTLAALILIIGLSVLLTFRFDASTERTRRESSERLLNQVSRNLDFLLRQTMRTADSIYYRVIKRHDLSEEALEQSIKLIYETNSDYLSDVCLFDRDGRLLLSLPYADLKPGVRPAEQEWFTEASEIIENVHFFKPQVREIFDDPGSSYQWVIPVSSSVELTRHGRVSQGVLLLNFKYSTITQALRNVELRDKGYIYLADAEGRLLYHPRLQLISGGYDEEKTLSYCSMPDDTYSDGEGQLITVNTVGYTGWKLVLVIPLNTSVSGVGEVRAFSFLFILLAALFIILINYIISTRIARPIKALEHQVAAYERGEIKSFGEGFPAPPEIEHLALAIRSFAAQQAELRRDMLLEQEAKRRSELDALQAQIHPHFLYNTLDSIVWMIENGRNDGAVEMVTSLARFFRLSLAKGKSVISIANELEQVRYYLSIQKVRFRNQFNFTVSLDEKIADCLTVKLIVQPLVENAIYHGTAELGEEGEIEVKAYAAGQSLIYIDVRDNGLGMTEEQKDALLRQKPMPGQSSRGSGIGVANVIERIHLFFGEEYGLEIDSRPDEGTLMRIIIPQRRAEAGAEGAAAAADEALLADRAKPETGKEAKDEN